MWPRAIHRLRPYPWSAALVAQHAVVVYDRFRSERDWVRFFSETETARDAMIRASGLSLDQLVADYPFLRLADLISLVFCMASTQEQHFAEWTVQLSGARVSVHPDPFGGLTIPIEIGAKKVSSQPFRDDAQLREALNEAPTVTIRGEVAGRSG